MRTVWYANLKELMLLCLNWNNIWEFVRIAACAEVAIVPCILPH